MSSSGSLPTVEIVGLGPAGTEYVSQHTLDRIAAHRHRWVRTTRHPSAHVVHDASSFDHLYESADSFDEVYDTIVETLSNERSNMDRFCTRSPARR